MKFMKEKKCQRIFISIFLAAVILIGPAFSIRLDINAQTSTANNGLVYFEEDFNISNGNIDGVNNWIGVYWGNNRPQPQKVKDGALIAEDFSKNSNGACECLIERPVTEATINQKASADILNLGELGNYASANLHLRVMHGDHKTKADESYFVEVTNEHISIKKAKSDWTVANLTVGGESVSYTHNYEHKYRVELSAIGLAPTTLIANLYDITDDDKLVATTCGTDDAIGLQSAGSAALSCVKNSAGVKTAKFDNFKYEQTDELISRDIFDRADGEIGNDWIKGSNTNAVIEGNVLKLKTNHPVDTFEPIIEGTALIRPDSEKSLDQIVEIDFESANNTNNNDRLWADIGGVVIARCQDGNVSDSYRLVTHLGFDGANNWKAIIYLLNSKGEKILEGEASIPSNTKCRLQLNVSSLSTTESQLVATLYDIGGETPVVLYQNQVIDNDPALQNAGTAGFSMLDRWDGTLNVYRFTHLKPPANTLGNLLPEDDKVPVSFSDDFNTSSGNLHNNENGWLDQQVLLGNEPIASSSDGKLIIDNGDYTGEGVYDYKLLRPMSEATLNQRVGIDILNLHELESVEIDMRIIEIPDCFEAISRQCFYTLMVDKNCLIFATRISWGRGEISGVEYEYTEGHVYRVEVTAEGSIPTVLNATLYDLTDGGKVVATLSATDQTLSTSNKRTAQIPSTIGISYCGEKPAQFDNFVYEQMDTVVCHDKFNRRNGGLENGWEIGVGAVASSIVSTKLSLNNSGNDNMWDARVMRPLSEAKVEQSVYVQYSRPDKSANLGAPIVFARAQTDKAVQIDGTNGFACYYAVLTFTGDWSSKISIYKVNASGERTLLREDDIDIYGKLSPETARLELMAQGTNPTKLTATLYVPTEKRIYEVYNRSVTDNEPELQKAGTTGISYTGTTKAFTVEKFSYLTPYVLPEEPAVPEDLDEDYMAFFSGTVASGNFGQWVEVDPGSYDNRTVFVYSVRIKKILDSGGFATRIQYNPQDLGHIYMDAEVISHTYDETACVETIEFTVPQNAHVQANGKSRIRVVVHEGGLSSTGYATDFKLYRKDDPNQTNYVINPDFKKGMFGWAGHGYYIQGAWEPDVMKTLGAGEVQLVKYDPLAFIRDDSDIYFDDGNWAAEYELNSDELFGSGTFKGSIVDAEGKPIKGVTLSLSPSDVTAVTDSSGSFSFGDVSAGIYNLYVKLKNGEELEFDEAIEIEDKTEAVLSLVYDDGNLAGEIIEGEVPEETVENDNDNDEDKEISNNKNNSKEDSYQIDWIVILIISVIVLAIALALVILIIKKRSKNK